MKAWGMILSPSPRQLPPLGESRPRGKGIFPILNHQREHFSYFCNIAICHGSAMSVLLFLLVIYCFILQMKTLLLREVKYSIPAENLPVNQISAELTKKHLELFPSALGNILVLTVG